MVQIRGLSNSTRIEEIGMDVPLVDIIMFLDVPIVICVGVLITLNLGVRETRCGYSRKATSNQGKRVSTNFDWGKGS